MAVLEIPTIADGETPFYTERVTLEDKDYFFKFYWNERRQRWTFDLYALSTGELIVGGQTIACETNLLRRSVSAETPPGLLTAIALNDSLEPPELLDLSDRVKLLYFTSDDEALA